ncbi:MAG: MoaD/ThiS family protein [Kofleriaceae bacterium]
MATVVFTPNLARHVPCPPREVSGATVAEVLAQVFVDNPRLRGYVLDEQGVLRKHMVVFVDGAQLVDRLRQSDPVGPGSEVYVMQALSGG